MAFSPYVNTATIDDHLVSFDKVPTEADRSTAVKRIAKGWDAVKADVDGLGGLKLQKPDFDDLVNHLVKANSHAVIFELVLTKSEFRLNVEAGNATIKAGAVAVPGGLEDYRNFLGALNGWSTSEHNIVPDADFKKWNADNPKAPPQYKDYEEMQKKSKSDSDAFRAWAKKNAKANKAFADLDKTAKAKPGDPARAAAMKAVNESLKDYYKSF